MSESFVRLEVEGPFATITIDRPNSLNALNTRTLEELEKVVADLSVRSGLRGAILTGAGEKAFVAGADIAEMQGMDALRAKHFGALGHRTMDALASLPVPVIAAVNGFALGGGCELALACDFIYASENARFGLPELSLGILPGFGGTQRLARLVGKARAKELIFTGDMVDAARAKAIGLALEVMPLAQLLPMPGPPWSAWQRRDPWRFAGPRRPSTGAWRWSSPMEIGWSRSSSPTSSRPPTGGRE
jgi:enoyl-CoA hydratase